MALVSLKAWAYSEVSGFTGETWYDHRASDFADGSGSQYYPYIINTAEQLALLAWKVNEEGNTFDGKYFRIDADISLKGYVWVPIGIHSGDNERVFKGTLSSDIEDGYRTISDMTIKATGTGKTAYFGFFGDFMGTAEGLKLAKAIININCDATVEVGTFCGEIGTTDGSDKRGALYRCDVESADITVNANDRSEVGGLIGTTDTYVGKLQCCVAKTKMTLTGVGSAGGVAGTCVTGMRDCHAVVDINATSTTQSCSVGGLAGIAWIDTHTDNFICCSTAGEINATGSDDNKTGGIFGHAYYNNSGFNKLQYSATCVTVSGTGYLGGIIGYCYAHCNPGLYYCFCGSFVDGRQAKFVGGIVGYIVGQGFSDGIRFGADMNFVGTMTKPTASDSKYGTIVGYLQTIPSSPNFGYCLAGETTLIAYDRLMCNLPTNGNGRGASSLGGIDTFTTPSLNAWDYSHYWMAIAPLQAPGANLVQPYYRDIYDLCSIPFHISPDGKNYFPAYDASVSFSLENLMNNYNHEKMANYQVEASPLVKVGEDLRVQLLDPGEVNILVTHKGLVRKVHLNITYGVEWDGTSTSTSFYGGDGSEANPYLIHNVAELKGAMESGELNKEGVYFKLVNDIFMNNHLLQDDETPRSGAHKWTPGEWKANLDGNGKMIYGLYVDEDDAEEGMGYGLFSSLYGTIKDLGIVDSYVRVNAQTSALDAAYAGMFCGQVVDNPRIERCLAHGVVTTNGRALAGGFAGTGYIDVATNTQFIDCLSAVHVHTNLSNAGAGIVMSENGNPVKLQRCLSVGKVDTGYGLVRNDDQNAFSVDSYFDQQMMKKELVNTRGAKLTSELASGEIFKGESVWVQQEGRYPMLAKFANTSYGDLLSMPISLYRDEEKTDRAGNVTEILEFITDDAEWHAVGGTEYMDVIQKCAAASLNQRTPDNSPEYLVGQSTIDISHCTQAKRSLALDIRVDGIVGIRFKDPAAERACLAAFDSDGNNVITLRESCDATNDGFKTLFNPAARENQVQMFPEMRYFVGVENLENGMLSGLSNLSELELPKQLLTIDEESFSGCSLLESVTLPSPFEETRPGAFYQSSIKNIFVAFKNKNLVSRQGVLYTTDDEFQPYPHALMAYPPARGQDTAVVCGPLKTILTGAIYKIPALSSVYIDNPLPEGEMVELLENGIVHETDGELMQVYINDGSSWGAELEEEDAPVLFEMYQNSSDWSAYFDAGKIDRYFPLNVTSAGWATLYIGFATQLPSQLSPYMVIEKSFEDRLAYLKRIKRIMPHETPVVIKAEAPGRYILYPYKNTVPELNKFENRLIGSFIGQEEKFGVPVNQQDLSNGSILTLGRNRNGTVGFYYYNSVTPIPPYRAYLTYNSTTSGQGAKPYFTFLIDDTLDEDIATGIRTADSRRDNQHAVYNLQGVKVNADADKLPKGIYIVGGQKVVVR